MKRLVVLVEGKGDELAVPTLVQRVLNHRGGNECFFLDGDSVRTKEVNKTIKDWARTIQYVVRTRRNLGAILVVLDGDADQVADPAYVQRYGRDFCARHVALYLASSAQASCAAKGVSIAVAIAMKEMECWAISVIDQLGNVDLSDGTVIPPGLAIPESPESIRDGKGWIEKAIKRKFKPTAHQKALAKHIPIDLAAQRSRSFRRFVHAIEELIAAVRDGNPIASPSSCL